MRRLSPSPHPFFVPSVPSVPFSPPRHLKAKLLPALLALVAILAWWRPWHRAPASPPEAPWRVSAPPAAANTAADELAPPAPRPPPLTEPAPAAISPAARQRVLDAIDNLDFCLRDYRAANGGNPVGTNPEIAAALAGDNPRQVKLPLPDGSTLNDRGELCDPWGTPWFFHQLSGTKMEIRSAGPDRVLHNADDIVR